jgi:hypothetical protein
MRAACRRFCGVPNASGECYRRWRRRGGATLSDRPVQRQLGGLEGGSDGRPGVSAFARYFMPDGLIRVTGPLPELGGEFVLDSARNHIAVQLAVAQED